MKQSLSCVRGDCFAAPRHPMTQAAIGGTRSVASAKVTTERDPPFGEERSTVMKQSESYPVALLRVDAALVCAGVTAVVTGLFRLVQLAFSGKEISVYLLGDPRHPMQWYAWYIGLSMSIIVWSPFGLAVGLADVLVWVRMNSSRLLWLAEILLCVLCSVLFSANWWSWMREGERLTLVWQRTPALLVGAIVGVISRRIFARKRLSTQGQVA